MRIRSILFLLFLSIQLPLSAQLFNDQDFRRSVQTGLDQMYNFSFESAGKSFYQLLEAHPDHPAPYFLLALNRWWQTYLSATMPDYYGYIGDKLKKAEDRLKLIEGKPGYEQEYIFFKFMIHALDARAHSFRNEWWPAMNSAKKLIDPMEKSLLFVGQADEFYMLAGLYHYYVETYHQMYPVIRPILSFFPDGDAELGLQELVKASGSSHIAQMEAKYFLGTIYNDEIFQYGKGVSVTRDLARRYPNNTWFQNDLAHALVLNRQFAEAKPIIDQLIKAYERQGGANSKNINSKSSRFTTYLMIRVYHNQGRWLMESQKDYEAALAAFDQSNRMAQLASVEEDFYLPANQYYKGLCFDFLGRRAEAVAAYEEVLDLEENTRFENQAKANIETAAKE